MVDRSSIYLLDAASDEAVEAELCDAIEQRNIDDWISHWRPARDAAIADLLARKVPQADWPLHAHWDWELKAKHTSLLAYAGFSVTSQGVTQGLALIDLTGSAQAQMHQGKPMVYLSYLEAAPWNQPKLVATPRLRGVGTALLAAAVARSEEEGFKGRIGLHSLPQADSFYRKVGFMDLGTDPQCSGLRYFEMSAERARAFLSEEE